MKSIDQRYPTKRIFFAAVTALVVLAPLSSAQAKPNLGDQIVQTIEGWFHWNPPPPKEDIGPLSESETAKTASAAFIQRVANSPRYTLALKNDPRIQRLIQNDPVLNLATQSADYQQHMALGPSIGFLFGEPSGVGEGYTVAQHTVRVLEIYEQQKKFYPLQRLQAEVRVRNLDSLLMWTLAFHDIGKSLAARGGNKAHETAYSCPMAADLIHAAGFTSDENRIANALIWSHQILGNYVRGKIAEDTIYGTTDPEQAAILGIRAAARFANVPPKTFFQLMVIVMTADAASYPSLHNRVFVTNSSGELIPTSLDQLNRLEGML